MCMRVVWAVASAALKQVVQAPSCVPEKSNVAPLPPLHTWIRFTLEEG